MSQAHEPYCPPTIGLTNLGLHRWSGGMHHLQQALIADFIQRMLVLILSLPWLQQYSTSFEGTLMGADECMVNGSEI